MYRLINVSKDRVGEELIRNVGRWAIRGLSMKHDKRHIGPLPSLGHAALLVSTPTEGRFELPDRKPNRDGRKAARIDAPFLRVLALRLSRLR